MSIKFTVPEIDVKNRDGDKYSIDLYREGEDYVERKCFTSFKRVFRSNIFDTSVVDDLQVPNDLQVPSVDEECKEIEHNPQTGGHGVKTCKVRRIHVNNRWIETDMGKIWVGAKGSSLKVGQIIRVLNGELFLKRTEPNPSLVRI